MTATIHNFADARARKVIEEMSDQRLKDRILLVEGELKGWDNVALQDMMRPMAFPNGFDPINHPEDNYDRLKEEHDARFPSS